MANQSYSKIDAAVDGNVDSIRMHAMTVWEYAEVSYKEFKSSAFIAELLESKGFVISDRGVGGLETSWIARFSQGSGGPVIGIMVEYDALPDLGNDKVPTQAPAKSGNTAGHGCGHNLIGSSSIGAALGLKKLMEEDNLNGTVEVYGCPAEEMLNGKNYMAMDGAFDAADVVLHNHPGPFSTVWNFHSAGAVDMELEFFGKTSHAGMAPWDGRSALHAMELALHALNQMREQMLPSSRLQYIIMNGGSAINVIPDYAKVWVRYRGPSAKNMLDYVDWIKDIAKGAALASRCTSKFTNLGGIHDCMANDTLGERMYQHMKDRYFPVEWTPEEHEWAKKIQKECGKPETGMSALMGALPKDVEVGGSSDVGTVTRMKPTMGCVYSAWPESIPPHQWGCTATVGTEIGVKASIQCAKTMAAVGFDILTEPKLLQKAKAEFDDRLRKDPFVALCESNKNPRGALDRQTRHFYECCIHGAMEAFGIVDPSHSH